MVIYANGIIRGSRIELDKETGLPDGTAILVRIEPAAHPVMRRALRVLTWAFVMAIGACCMGGVWWVSPNGQVFLTVWGGSVGGELHVGPTSLRGGWGFMTLDNEYTLRSLGYTSARFSRNEISFAGFNYDRIAGVRTWIALPLWPALLATAAMLFWNRRWKKRLEGKGFEVVGAKGRWPLWPGMIDPLRCDGFFSHR
jgi:hypothetical protein